MESQGAGPQLVRAPAGSHGEPSCRPANIALPHHPTEANPSHAGSGEDGGLATRNVSVALGNSALAAAGDVIMPGRQGQPCARFVGGQLGYRRGQNASIPRLHDIAAGLGKLKDSHARIVPAWTGQYEIVPAAEHELKGRRLLASWTAHRRCPSLRRRECIQLGKRHRPIAILVGGAEQARVQVVGEERPAQRNRFLRVLGCCTGG
jgi:hypothetical protein